MLRRLTRKRFGASRKGLGGWKSLFLCARQGSKSLRALDIGRWSVGGKALARQRFWTSRAPVLANRPPKELERLERGREMKGLRGARSLRRGDLSGGLSATGRSGTGEPEEEPSRCLKSLRHHLEL